MKSIATVIIFIIFANNVLAQGWIKRKNTLNALYTATGASALGSGFLTGGSGTGHYKYDTLTRNWSYASPLPGPSRYCAVSGTINNKIYYGLGFCPYSYNTNDYKSLYEYNPTTNSWAQKATFPGAARILWAYFTLNNKLYVTLGKGYINSGIGHVSDTWEYNPVTNAWTQRDSFPGIREAPSFFSIGNKGYVIGRAGSNPGSELWQYDPATDNWTQKATCPIPDQGGIAFSIDSMGYFLTSNVVRDTPTFWQYNPSTDTWTKLRDFPGPHRYAATSFSIGNSGFITTGEHGPPSGQSGPSYELDDLWEYNLDCPADIINDLSVDSLKPLYCADSVLIDTIEAYSVQHSSVIYKWLSSPDNITYTALSNSNTPFLDSQMLTQTKYFKRVVTFNAGCIDTSQPLKINIVPYNYANIDTLSKTTVCFGDTVTLHCNSQYFKRWYANGIALPDTTDTLKVWNSGSFFAMVSNQACSFPSIDTIKVTVHPSTATPIINATWDHKGYICITHAFSYQWYDSLGNALTGETDSVFYPKSSGRFYLIITDSNRCSAKSRILHFSKPDVIGEVGTTEHKYPYPNPIQDIIHIFAEGTSQYKVYNIYGVSLLEGILLDGDNAVSMGSLPPGYLFLEIINGIGKKRVNKIIKE